MESRSPSPSFRIERVPPARADEALGALLTSGPAAAARFARQAASAGIRLDFMWGVVSPEGVYRMAVLGIPSVGRTAMILASRARSDADVESLGLAIAEALGALSDESDLAQSLLEPDRLLDIAACVRGGLQQIAVLDYLERTLPRTGALALPPSPAGWSIEPVADASVLDAHDAAAIPTALHEELERLLEASYIDTLDCPGLEGMRATSDVLDGHFAIGPRRRFWFFARHEGRALGVCMLNGPVEREGVPAGDSAELVYLGLSPEARGKGIARTLLMHGMHACSNARLRTISLAVDSRNGPARKLYASLGFTRVSSRAALVRELR
ncbi:MAG: GNAT family N-acetyltransferase [Phycisphaerales bacterium]